MRSGEKVAVDLTELGLQVFHRELLIPTGLPKHLPTCCDASKGVARRHGFDVGIEQPFHRLEVPHQDSVDEPACAVERHRAAS